MIILKNKPGKTVLSLGFVALLAATVFWLHRDQSPNTQQGHDAPGSVLNQPSESVNGSLAVTQENRRRLNFGMDDFFKAKTAVEAMSLLPQLADIDPETRTQMVMELNNLCILNSRTDRLSESQAWLGKATNNYCAGYTAMDIATFHSLGEQTKSHFISAALRENYKKEGPDVLDESIAALVASSADPYERSEALTFAAQHSIPIKALATSLNGRTDFEIKNTLEVAAHISFCKNNSACGAYGLRSLLACYGFSECKRATPFLEQLRQRTSPQMYSEAQRLILQLEGKQGR